MEIVINIIIFSTIRNAHPQCKQLLLINIYRRKNFEPYGKKVQSVCQRRLSKLGNKPIKEMWRIKESIE